MPSSRKRRPQSFDLTPPDSEGPASGWTYRTETPRSVVKPLPAGQRQNVMDWVTWPVQFLFVMLFVPPPRARRKP
jgi:hypothetical protein